MNNKDVCHNWANGQLNCKGDNLSASNGILYSYAMPIGIYLGDYVILNNDGCSVTTAKHKNYAFSASTHKKQIKVSFLDKRDPYLKASLLAEDLLYSYNELVKTYYAKRKIDLDLFRSSLNYIADSAEYLIELIDQNVFSNYLKLDINADKAREILDPLVNADPEKIFSPEKMEEAKQAQRAIKEAKKAKEKAEQIEALKDLGEWLADLSLQSKTKFLKLPVKLRINNERIETSHGASALLTEAKKLFEIANINGFDQLLGQRIGNFRFDSFNKNILKIGCHEIDVQEIRRVLE